MLCGQCVFTCQESPLVALGKRWGHCASGNSFSDNWTIFSFPPSLCKSSRAKRGNLGPGNVKVITKGKKISGPSVLCTSRVRQETGSPPVLPPPFSLPPEQELLLMLLSVLWSFPPTSRCPEPQYLAPFWPWQPLTPMASHCPSCSEMRLSLPSSWVTGWPRSKVSCTGRGSSSFSWGLSLPISSSWRSCSGQRVMLRAAAFTNKSSPP